VIEAVVSDFGGVLTTPLFDGFAGWQEEHGVPVEALGRAMARAAAGRGEHPLHPLERGELSWEGFLELLDGALTAEVGRPVTMAGFAEAYWSRLEHNEPFIAYLRELRGRGVRLALLTNNVREWEPRWRPRWPIDELFETVVDSGFVGMRKPDPRIYELTLERLSLPPAACAFVDDLEVNCDAAAALGMHAVRFRDTDEAIAALEALLATA
jgi:putative hydrolase of the HAD superfamily